ncbi:hypothetical protein K435DRAFT_851366 [Dendrothele bispora CBS 962.96]|uniref:Uncharacterized protein n=1 Tax=Dendrothele bispora (strain CBS 962.96) TaxID=1314807 RepID=A0A4S8MM57_DENBC|nr:hypothetical protein K435DRAFT_851366 [Dendrothele bispora CBS 962.96]
MSCLESGGASDYLHFLDIMGHIPTGGTFVAFTVDLVASVAHLDNPELTTACSELQTSQKQFIAYVRRDNVNMPLSSRRLNAFHFLPVWQGHENVPGPLKAHNVSPSMLFPVLPNTYQPGSCERHRAVDPCRPLPWGDCYISSAAIIDVRCEIEWTEAEDKSAPYQTTIREEIRLIRQMANDNSVIYQSSIAIPPPVSSGKSFDSDLPPEAITQVVGWKDGEPDLLNIRMTSLLCGVREMGDKFIVQYTTDLSTVDRVNHPDELFIFLARFERLKAEMEESRKLQEIERARKIDEQYFADLSPQTSLGMAPRSSKWKALKRCSQKWRRTFAGAWLRRYVCTKAPDHIEDS